MNMRGPPRIVMIPPWIGTRFDRDELVVSRTVGDGTADPIEVRIDRRRPVVPHMLVSTTGISLPNLDQRIRYRPPIPIQQSSVHENPLPLWFLRMLSSQIVIELPHPARSEQRAGDL